MYTLVISMFSFEVQDFMLLYWLKKLTSLMALQRQTLSESTGSTCFHDTKSTRTKIHKEYLIAIICVSCALYMERDGSLIVFLYLPHNSMCAHLILMTVLLC